MNIIRYAIVVILFCGSALTGPAQSVQKDDSLNQPSIDSLISLYTKQTGANLLVFNGSVYIPSPVSKNGFPYFSRENAVEGSVFYDGNLYQHLNLQYDLSRDELVYSNFSHTALMRLAPEKIGYFTIQQHLFVYLEPEKNIGLPKMGFYEKLFDGNITIVARREKNFNQKLNLDGVNVSRYDSHDTYYIKNGLSFFAVAGKRDVLKVLNDQKSLITKYISANRLNFKKQFEESLVKTATYYSGLKK